MKSFVDAGVKLLVSIVGGMGWGEGRLYGMSYGGAGGFGIASLR